MKEGSTIVMPHRNQVFREKEENEKSETKRKHPLTALSGKVELEFPVNYLD